MMTNSRSTSQSLDAHVIPIRGDGGAMFYRASLYEIVVAGHLDKKWSDWLGSMEITHDNAGQTVLNGSITDQAALHGILTRIRDLGLVLISLNPQEMETEEKDSTL
jgi:hypothetical protein